MREIKFRGYNAKNKEWLYGCYLINRGEHFICPDGIQPADKTSEDFQIDPETLGQFTGLKDKHGKEIYEGDVLKENTTKSKYIVEWRADTAAFVMVLSKTDQWYNMMFAQHIKIIGNIHDNPELVKGGEQ